MPSSRRKLQTPPDVRPYYPPAVSAFPKFRTAQSDYTYDIVLQPAELNGIYFDFSYGRCTVGMRRELIEAALLPSGHPNPIHFVRVPSNTIQRKLLKPFSSSKTTEGCRVLLISDASSLLCLREPPT